MPAVKEPHLAKVVTRERELDPRRLALVVRPLDLGIRQLYEIGVLEHAGERAYEIRVSGRERSFAEARMRIDVGGEVEIVLAQPLQPLEIVVVTDGREPPADLAEACPLAFAAERPMLRQRIQQVALADGNEPLAAAGAAVGGGIRHCA